EFDDLIEPLLYLAACQSEHDAVDEHVLPAGDLGMETGAQLNQRRDAPLDSDRAARRFRDAGNEFERGALAGAVSSDHAERVAARHGERHAVERGKRLVGPQIPYETPLQERALQCRKPAATVAAIDLRDVVELDGRRHTASANESRSRSNTQYAA